MDCTFQELIRHMLATSGKTAAQVSRELGNDSNHLSVILSSGRTPRLDLFVKIAEACGYHVELTGWGELEAWEIYAEDGALVAVKEHGEEDMPELERERMKAFESVKASGRNELIDELVEYLQGLKEE